MNCRAEEGLVLLLLAPSCLATETLWVEEVDELEAG